MGEVTDVAPPSARPCVYRCGLRVAISECCHITISTVLPIHMLIHSFNKYLSRAYYVIEVVVTFL